MLCFKNIFFAVLNPLAQEILFINGKLLIFPVPARIQFLLKITKNKIGKFFNIRKKSENLRTIFSVESP